MGEAQVGDGGIEKEQMTQRFAGGQVGERSIGDRGRGKAKRFELGHGGQLFHIFIGQVGFIQVEPYQFWKGDDGGEIGAGEAGREADFGGLAGADFFDLHDERGLSGGSLRRGFGIAGQERGKQEEDGKQSHAGMVSAASRAILGAGDVGRGESLGLVTSFRAVVGCLGVFKKK